MLEIVQISAEILLNHSTESGLLKWLISILLDMPESVRGDSTFATTWSALFKKSLIFPSRKSLFQCSLKCFEKAISPVKAIEAILEILSFCIFLTNLLCAYQVNSKNELSAANEVLRQIFTYLKKRGNFAAVRGAEADTVHFVRVCLRNEAMHTNSALSKKRGNFAAVRGSIVSTILFVWADSANEAMHKIYRFFMPWGQ